MSGSFELQLTTVDPLHVGSGVSNYFQFNGRTELARDIVVQKVGDVELPVVPGASLKGAVRSIAEALGGGCDLGDPCDPPCVVCTIFGHLKRAGGYLGRVGFDDAHPKDPKAAAERVGALKLPTAFQPRIRRGRRIYGVAPKAADTPVPYVVVDRGVTFTTRLRVQNLTVEELGLVLLASGVGATFCLRIGGGKFANLGRIRWAITGATLRRGYVAAAPERLDAKAAKDLADGALRAASEGLTPKAREVLRAIETTLGDPS